MLPDPAAPLAVALGSRPQAVATRSPGTASIGILSLRGDGIGVDTAVEAIRLAKTANAVCHYAGAPDILAVSGVRGQATLDELARALNAADGNLLFPGSCHGNPGYQARLLPSAGTTGPRLGFIVRSSSPVAALRRVDVVSISRAGPAVTQRNPDGTREPLGVSPPLLLEAVIRRGNERSIAVTVVVAALSPLDADPAAIGSHGWRTRGEAARARRFAEAGTLGRLLRERQRTHPGEKLVVLGNFEASEFGDGHVDLLDLVANGPQPRAPRPVAPSLLNLTTRLPADERYSVVRDGNAQMVDHILVNRALLSEFPDAGIAVARINADFAEDNADDAGVPMRVSEHDPVLLLLDSAN